MALNEGDILAGKYRIERELGEGGMGAVYVATNLVLQKRVALKVMNERFASVPAAVERFLREAVAASRVSHSGIVQVFDAGEHEKKPWIAMELLEGESLGERLERGGPMSVEDVLKMADGALSALAEVHEEGIIHRDLKPDNIFLAKMRGGDWVPKVLDFGVAKDTSDGQLSKLTATGAVVGTAHYLSPEQAKGLADIDARADVYAMGVVLFEALSGRMPYEAETITQLIAKMFTEDPRSLHAVAPHVPKPVADVVSTCLEQDRTKRFQTARALHGALRSAAEAAKGGAVTSNPGYAQTAVAMPSQPGGVAASPPAHGSARGAFPATMVAGTPMPASRDQAYGATAVLPSSPPPAMPAKKSGSRAGLFAAVAAVFVLGAAGTGVAAWLVYGSDGEPVTPVAHAVTPTAGTIPDEMPPEVDPVAPPDPVVPPGVDPSELGASSDTAPAVDPVAPDPTDAVEDVDEGDEPDPRNGRRPRRRSRDRDRDPEPQQQLEQRPDPPRDPDPAPAQPGLAHAQVMNAIQSQLPRLQQRCYQPRLAQVPGLQGVITVSWTVAGDGRAQNARVVHNGTGDAALARCTSDIVLGTTFPRAANGQPTPARYPFQFRVQ